jgi:hypothetical protein
MLIAPRRGNCGSPSRVPSHTSPTARCHRSVCARGRNEAGQYCSLSKTVHREIQNGRVARPCACRSSPKSIEPSRGVAPSTRYRLPTPSPRSSGSWPNMGLDRLAKRPCVRSGRRASSTFEPSPASASSSLARPLRTEPCTGTYRLAFYSREHLSWRDDLSNDRVIKTDRRGVRPVFVHPNANW